MLSRPWDPNWYSAACQVLVSQDCGRPQIARQFRRAGFGIRITDRTNFSRDSLRRGGPGAAARERDKNDWHPCHSMSRASLPVHRSCGRHFYIKRTAAASPFWQLHHPRRLASDPGSVLPGGFAEKNHVTKRHESRSMKRDRHAADPPGVWCWR